MPCSFANDKSVRPVLQRSWEIFNSILTVHHIPGELISDAAALESLRVLLVLPLRPAFEGVWKLDLATQFPPNCGLNPNPVLLARCQSLCAFRGRNWLKKDLTSRILSCAWISNLKQACHCHDAAPATLPRIASNILSYQTFIESHAPKLVCKCRPLK